jgi:hypothetical protein
MSNNVTHKILVLYELQIVTIEKKYRDMQTHTQVAASQKSGLRNNGHTWS